MTRLVNLTVWTMALAAMLWTAGCATTDGGTPRAWGRHAQTPQSFDPLALRDMGLTTRWIHTVSTVGKAGITDLELLGDRLIAVEGPSNMVTVLDLDTGELVWKKKVGLALENLFKPLRRGDRVYVNSETRIFTLDADTGELVGVAKLASLVASGAVLYNEYAIFGAANGTLFAHDVEAGRSVWEYRFTGQITAPPTLAGDDVFAADSVGTYAMIDANTGKPAWRNKVFGPVTTSATIHRADVLLPSHDRSLYALNRATGADDWVYRATAPLTGSPLSVGRDVYLPVPGQGLVALDSRGTKKWEITTDATPVLAGKRGIYAVGRDALLLLDPETGDVKQSVHVAGIDRALPGPNGSLVVLTRTGRTVRLDAID